MIDKESRDPLHETLSNTTSLSSLNFAQISDSLGYNNKKPFSGKIRFQFSDISGA